MAEILISDPALTRRCARYIALCAALGKKIAELQQDSNIAESLHKARLHTKYILVELQMLKIQGHYDIKITEKQIMLLRNRFVKTLALYQQLFLPHIPYPMQDVAKRLEVLDLRHEEAWSQDLRMLGLALTLFGSVTEKSNSYAVILDYQYQFAGLLRNSIFCKNLRVQLGQDNHKSKLRREQLAIFHSFADDQIGKQRAFFARTQSIGSLANAVRITRGLVELGFVTGSEFFDTEYYKKQDGALTKVLQDAKNAATDRVR